MIHDPLIRATVLRAVLIDQDERPNQKMSTHSDPLMRALLLRAIPVLGFGLLSLLVA